MFPIDNYTGMGRCCTHTFLSEIKLGGATGIATAATMIFKNKLLTVAPEKYVDCGTCEAFCPNGGVNLIEFEVPRVAVPIMCMQCEDAACIARYFTDDFTSFQ